MHGCGPVAGKLFCIIVAIDVLLHYLLCWLLPESQIDIAPDFNFEQYMAEDMKPPDAARLPMAQQAETVEPNADSDDSDGKPRRSIGELKARMSDLRSHEDDDLDFQIT